MECVGTDCKQNARVVCDLETKMQNLPCFARKCDFCVLEGLRGGEFMFLTLGNMKNLFEMNTTLGYIRYKSYVVFARFLGFKEKCEVIKQRACTCLLPRCTKLLYFSLSLWSWFAAKGLVQCSRETNLQKLCFM